MPALERVPTDVVGNELVGLYVRGAVRLQTAVRDGLKRGLDPSRYATPGQQVGDATLAYQERQLRLCMAILSEIKAQGAAAVPRVTYAAYNSPLLAVDAVLGSTGGGARGTFGGVHQGVMRVLASNLERSLEKAAANVQSNLQTVFARAAALEGALPPNGVAGLGFVGRRTDDAWRKLTLETIGSGTAALETRRQQSDALIRRLLDEGVTDAVTGFVDKAGRRWSLASYAEMAIRTTTREATSRATVNRLLEHGEDLVTVSSHPHKADECTPFDGETFSLSGEDRRYPRLTVLAPFHPRCRHVIGPAAVSLDDYERELERAVKAQTPAAGSSTSTPNPTAAPAPAPTKTPEELDAAVYGDRSSSRLPSEAELKARAEQRAGRDVMGNSAYAQRQRADRGELLPFGPEGPRGRAPFSQAAEPTHDAGTVDRLEDQRIANLIAGDPGPEPGYLEALGRELATVGRREVRALNRTLGPDLVKVVNSAWGKKNDVRRRLMNGDLTVSDLEDDWTDEWNRRNDRRIEREYRARYHHKPIPCFICGKFKRRPSDVCEYCGDDPVPLGISEAAFNRGYGFSY